MGIRIVVVHKNDGTVRICVDYRHLNDITQKVAHPLPRIDNIYDVFCGAKYFSTLDLASGYHQVPVDVGDQEETGFVTPWGRLRVYSNAIYTVQGARYISASNSVSLLRTHWHRLVDLPIQYNYIWTNV